MTRFLVGATLREVKNARLNCNNADNEQYRSSTKNTTYVKKIRKGGATFPYASAQWQKKAIKGYAEGQGESISPVMSVSTTEATSEGNPFTNFDEDVMGFMIAKSEVITEEQYKELKKEDQKGWKKAGKEGYKRNVTVKRRSNLMLSTLQAIGDTRITDEFSTRHTDATPLLYTKEVYAADMANSFILDIKNLGEFTASENEAGYRDYTLHGAKENGLTLEEGIAKLDKETKKERITKTLKGIQLLPTRVTMANNLEDMSSKFMIFAEYSIGNSLFNNIFEDNKLKVEYLKEAIEENEDYRLSKIYIGVRSEYFKQEVGEKEYMYLKEIIEEEFGEDDRFIIGDINTVITEYLSNLEV